MTTYVALLRGITPSNPNMRNEMLRGVFEDIGFENVQSVISSGNILFETGSRNLEELESTIEKALLKQLDFKSTTIVYSKDELQSFINEKPFKNLKDTPQSKLNVTFLKNKPNTDVEFPYQSENKGFTVVGIYNRAICSVVDLSKGKTPDLMRWMEKEFGKNLTTRTWKTVDRIMKRLD
ncbi:DUF1697 domain-containing protein [Methanobacterium sp.]|uniref:DUF1697 domain-containing protein n=1 Tax=Methanobacterium sp. TaxID=2164 RepID=UPI0025F3EC9E|nr:DUF1697 domain-containing protein [Methanobacterium sp.]MBI5458927.1 DUF1697 domain-containing protein [Methanobacterium sp.]